MNSGPRSASVAVRDEAFWSRQERRRERGLGQPCCTQSGMSWSMMDMKGDFAVVVHGEFDCLNCFHHHIGQSASNFFSTRLTEHQIITGETAPPLRRLLTLLAAERAPEAVIVLGTCPVEVIGDRFEVVVDEVAAATGTPMIALHTSGLKLSSQRDMLDWLFTELSSLPAAPPIERGWRARATRIALDLLFEEGGRAEHALQQFRDGLATPCAQRRVNIVGLPDEHGRVPELVSVLAEVGVEVNGLFPFGASIRDWRAIGHAEATYMVDPDMFPRFAERLRALGQPVHAIGLPVGLQATLEVYEQVAAGGCHGTALAEALKEKIAPLEEARQALRERTSGKRLGLAIRMLNTHQTDQLAYEGLGDLPALLELGFEVELLVQGPPEESTRTAFAARLAELELDLPFRVFEAPAVLDRFLAEGNYALAVVPDSSRDEAHRAGVPMLSARSLRPFLAGVLSNYERITAALDSGRVSA